jgi:hypothetical protein
MTTGSSGPRLPVWVSPAIDAGVIRLHGRGSITTGIRRRWGVSGRSGDLAELDHL